LTRITPAAPMTAPSISLSSVLTVRFPKDAEDKGQQG
jgi:hypothetical protein